ncbi:uncharacterized membrane protein YjjP (DUF1212 family) [Kribbella amoyensis]|uniref:Uncharacterized membrane protein YjjP (DUF1212 family) n=1 Tax=Kribbella amoyensis TaxID=996641 RepID=A0A561B782_9ACTN|nr:threonine/serine exporter family protein [Kribbella amoyensis]TWD74834.1 uncharacterized membrane protein YjjP (DUF1212 family) [Kribbella amoyensis]
MSSSEPFGVTVRIASLLLASSAEGVGMLELYVTRVARAFGIEVGLLILPEQILLADRSSPASAPVAVVRAAPGLSRLDQVAALKVLVADIEAGLAPAEAGRRVDELAASGPRWPAWLRVVGVMLFAVGFAPSVVATASEVAATALLGAVMGVLLVSFERRRFEPVLPFVAAFTLTVLAATLLDGMTATSGVVLVVVPALFVVVPGDYLSASVAELVAGHLSAGAVRLVYAALLLGMLVVGIVGATQLTDRDEALTETPVEATLPFLVVVLAWIPFTVGLVLAFNGQPRMVPWLLPTVIGTYLLQQGATRLGGDVFGTLLAGIALGAVANVLSAPNHRPPRLLLVVGGFFVLTVGGLGLRGFTALIGGDVISGFDSLRDFLLQVPTVAISIAIGVLATTRRITRTR